MKPNTIGFAALLSVTFGAALALELTPVFWANWTMPFFAVFTFCGLLLAGGMLHVSGRVLGRGLAGYLCAMALLWFLPLNPIERFVHDVGHLRVGMSAAQVASVMSHQVAGVALSDDHRDGADRVQLLMNTSYFEPQRQPRCFDTYCLVRWQSGRVAGIEAILD